MGPAGAVPRRRPQPGDRLLMRLAIAVLCAAAAPAAAPGGELGAPVRVAPLTRTPGASPQRPSPGRAANWVRALRLEGRGGPARGGAPPWSVPGAFGFEARVDTADLSVPADAAVVRPGVPLSPPLPPLTTDV